MPIFANEICEKYCEKQGQLLDVLLDLVEMFCFDGTSGSIHTFLHSAGVTVSWCLVAVMDGTIPLRLRAEAAH